MHLHSAYPYWMISEGIEHSYPTLRRNLRCDVAIVGAGITGAEMGVPAVHDVTRRVASMGPRSEERGDKETETV